MSMSGKTSGARYPRICCAWGVLLSDKGLPFLDIFVLLFEIVSGYKQCTVSTLPKMLLGRSGGYYFVTLRL